MKKKSGQGAANQTGLQAVASDLVLIQDADLEYDPRDYPMLLQPINEGLADVVYGFALPGRTAPADSVLEYGG
jgi:glycosyltransferase involved in cell wall biosynthesis